MDLKQIISLHLDKYSNRKIASTLGLSRNTVNGYMNRFKASEYTLSELLNFDNEKLSKLFTSFTTMDIERQDELMRFFERVNQAREHPGFTFLYHYREYEQAAKEPYNATSMLGRLFITVLKSNYTKRLFDKSGQRRTRFTVFINPLRNIPRKGKPRLAVALSADTFVLALSSLHF